MAQLRHSDRERRVALTRRWGEAFAPVRFTLDHLSLISRSDRDPFEIVRTVPLGRRAADGRALAVQALRRAAGEILGDRAWLRVVGSTALGVALEDSDIDVVVFTREPIGWELFLARDVGNPHPQEANPFRGLVRAATVSKEEAERAGSRVHGPDEIGHPP